MKNLQNAVGLSLAAATQNDQVVGHIGEANSIMGQIRKVTRAGAGVMIVGAIAASMLASPVQAQTTSNGPTLQDALGCVVGGAIGANLGKRVNSKNNSTTGAVVGGLAGCMGGAAVVNSQQNQPPVVQHPGRLPRHQPGVHHPGHGSYPNADGGYSQTSFPHHGTNGHAVPGGFADSAYLQLSGATNGTRPLRPEERASIELKLGEMSKQITAHQKAESDYNLGLPSNGYQGANNLQQSMTRMVGSLFEAARTFNYIAATGGDLKSHPMISGNEQAIMNAYQANVPYINASYRSPRGETIPYAELKSAFTPR